MDDVAQTLDTARQEEDQRRLETRLSERSIARMAIDVVRHNEDAVADHDVVVRQHSDSDSLLGPEPGIMRALIPESLEQSEELIRAALEQSVVLPELIADNPFETEEAAAGTIGQDGIDQSRTITVTSDLAPNDLRFLYCGRHNVRGRHISSFTNFNSPRCQESWRVGRRNTAGASSGRAESQREDNLSLPPPFAASMKTNHSVVSAQCITSEMGSRFMPEGIPQSYDFMSTANNCFPS